MVRSVAFVASYLFTFVNNSSFVCGSYKPQPSLLNLSVWTRSQSVKLKCTAISFDERFDKLKMQLSPPLGEKTKDEVLLELTSVVEYFHMIWLMWTFSLRFVESGKRFE